MLNTFNPQHEYFGVSVAEAVAFIANPSGRAPMVDNSVQYINSAKTNALSASGIKYELKARQP